MSMVHWRDSWIETSSSITWTSVEKNPSDCPPWNVPVPAASTKVTYFNNEITQCAGNQKGLFNIVHRLLHSKGEACTPCSSTLELAETFSQFFTIFHKIERIRDKLDNQVSEVIEPMLNAEPLLICFKPATVDEVLEIIKRSSSAFCCLDPWATWLLKEHGYIACFNRYCKSIYVRWYSAKKVFWYLSWRSLV